MAKPKVALFASFDSSRTPWSRSQTDKQTTGIIPAPLEVMPFSPLELIVFALGQSVGEDLRGFGAHASAVTAGLVGFPHGHFIVGLGDLVLGGSEASKTLSGAGYEIGFNLIGNSTPRCPDLSRAAGWRRGT